MKKYAIWTCMVVLLVAAVANIGWRKSSAKQPEAYRARTSVGQPYIFQCDLEYPQEIGEIAVNNRYLYTLYEALLTVEVFDLNGQYVCSIAVADESGFMNPARCHVYAYDDAFFMECFGAVYEFQGTEFVRHHRGVAARTLRKQLESKRGSLGDTAYGSDGALYRIRGMAVAATHADGTEKVVLQRPAWTICYLTGFSWSITLLCICGALFLHTRLEKK